MSIWMYAIMFIDCAIGVVSILGVVIPLIGVIAYKIYRKIRYGISLYN